VKFKLDENLPFDLKRVFPGANHDVMTVAEENISGCENQALYDICQREHRILISLDLDFAHPFRFPPGATSGIIVLRPHRPVLALLRALLATALNRLQAEEIAGKLWIVEPEYIRIYEPEQK
jgi:predicted nuclease of predicted toxin-antitoxin system